MSSKASSRSNPTARNAPCPCGSGRRLKHCHGRFNASEIDQETDRQLREHVLRLEAQEMLRKRQQGFGRPMITALNSGKRVVVVGKRIVHSADWRYVGDFLLENLKTVLGREWGASASLAMPDHRLFQWLQQLHEARNKVGVGDGIPVKGHLSALNRLGYALYLIEHNDTPPKSLVKRLRRPTDFDPALYEAIVGSAFTLAGAKIEGAEDVRSNQPKPEFFAKFPNGKTYAVEAKRKRSWRAAFDLESDAFVAELRSWLRDKLHGASKKLLANPVYWLELSIGEEMTEAQFDRLRELVLDAVKDAETFTVKGRPPSPAYVFVTNNPDLVNDDAIDLKIFNLLMGFAMDDFREGIVDLETAMDRHDKHRAILWVHKCLELVQQVPTNFEGVPDELLDDSGQPIDIMKIGTFIKYPREDGLEAFGKIEEIVSIDRNAFMIVADRKTERRVMVKMPLTEQEANAAKKLGNAIFGKPEAPREAITDPLKFYDRMLEIYGNASREELLHSIDGHPELEEFRRLGREDLVIRVAREMTFRAESLKAND